MLKLVFFVNILNLIGSSNGCFPATKDVLRNQNNEIELSVDNNNQVIGNLIAIKPQKVCLVDADYIDQVFVCYNHGDCNVKIVLINSTHYLREPYCLCQDVFNFLSF